MYTVVHVHFCELQLLCRGYAAAAACHDCQGCLILFYCHRCALQGHVGQQHSSATSVQALEEGECHSGCAAYCTG